METQHIIHNFEPIYNEHSKILMLGTMPSPKSREVGFYYGHPRNRFWKVVSDVCGETYPETREDKITFALRKRSNYIRSSVIRRLGLWQSGYHPPVRQTAEHRMSSSMKHILKSENI